MRSVKTTLVILVVLAGFLLLNVMVPQTAIMGEDRVAEAAAEGAVGWFLIEVLGFDSLTTNPVFLVTLGLFFLNLTSVLAVRARMTLKRSKPKPPSVATLESWATKPSSRALVSSGEITTAQVRSVLRGLGYSSVAVGNKVVWGLKHGRAAIGFLIFHLGFFPLCAGGISLYLTRFVATVTLIEGQAFQGYSEIVRQAPMGGQPVLEFTVDKVETRMEQGQPVYLGVHMSFFEGGRRSAQVSRVNHPVSREGSKLLASRAGLAAVLWLQDSAGYTVDRIAVAVTNDRARGTEILLGDGVILCRLRTAHLEGTFPARDELAGTTIHVTAGRDEQILFEGELHPGEGVQVGEYRLVLEDLRYWAGLYVVSERGGWLLITGFLMTTIGLIWRLLAFRREVAVVWNDDEIRLGGRAEYFSAAVAAELETLSTYLEREV